MPSDTVRIGSVLFSALPRSLVVFPVVFEGQIKAVLALASLHDFAPAHLAFLEQLTASIGIVFNSIEATMQTEGCSSSRSNWPPSYRRSRRSCSRPTSSWRRRPSSSPSRTSRWSARTRRSSRPAGRWKRRHRVSPDLQVQVRVPGQHVARAAHAAQQHSGPGQQLGDNPDGNLTPRQVEFARTIHGAGTDLLNLISDILDLSKIESARLRWKSRNILHQPARHGSPSVPT